jgi:hypothetical protein
MAYCYVFSIFIKHTSCGLHVPNSPMYIIYNCSILVLGVLHGKMQVRKACSGFSFFSIPADPAYQHIRMSTETAKLILAKNLLVVKACNTFSLRNPIHHALLLKVVHVHS